MRTWGTEEIRDQLARAADRGLRISSGIWLPHAPAAYEECDDLDADAWWNAQLASYVAAVRENKNSTALLWWTVGNEEELEVDVFRGNECVWKRLEWAVQAVKAEDPNHPVGTVTAGAMEPKVRLINEFCPSLDFLGVNSYGADSLIVGSSLQEWNFTKPYAIMEFGPRGHWVANRTEWGAYIEDTSSEKVPLYNATCYACKDDPFCIGAFAFVWGWKWEKTGTWYNMFNEWPDVTQNVSVPCTECEAEALGALQQCWTGGQPVTRPPTITGVEVNGSRLDDMSFIAPRSESVPVRVVATHPLGETLVGIYAVTDEIVSNAVGGAYEATNPLVAGVWPAAGVNATTGASTAENLSVTMNTSGLSLGGEFRLYIFVRQDPETCQPNCRHQEAYASLAFRICHTAQAGEDCQSNVSYAMQTGIRTHPAAYPGLDGNSTFEEIQAMLYQMGRGSCPPPCGARDWCHTATQGEECYVRVQSLMDNQTALPHSLQNASFETVQAHIQSSRDGVCPRPCAEAPAANVTDSDSSAGRPAGLDLSAANRAVVGLASALLWSAWVFNA
uniref:Uncharacterized protein n=1 Tax=Zooxanthella nutricula TaxID=1333877 RepID=A0A7S2L9Y0_9DINO